jgi:hypothetical protein
LYEIGYQVEGGEQIHQEHDEPNPNPDRYVAVSRQPFQKPTHIRCQAQQITQGRSSRIPSPTALSPMQELVLLRAETDEHEAVGTGFGAKVSSFCFFASGAIIGVQPDLLGMQGLAVVIVAAVMVELALLGIGAAVGLLSDASPVKRRAPAHDRIRGGRHDLFAGSAARRRRCVTSASFVQNLDQLVDGWHSGETCRRPIDPARQIRRPAAGKSINAIDKDRRGSGEGKLGGLFARLQQPILDRRRRAAGRSKRTMNSPAGFFPVWAFRNVQDLDIHALILTRFPGGCREPSAISFSVPISASFVLLPL